MVEYYKWADKKIIDLLTPLDDQTFNKKVEITRKSLRDLSEHIMAYFDLYINPNLKFNDVIAKYNKMSKDKLLESWEKIVISFVDKVLSKDFNEKVDT